MLVLSSFFTGVGVGLAVLTGDPTGEAIGLGLETGAGVGAGLFGISGLFSHAAKMAVAVARAVVNISFLIVFLLRFYTAK
jgi:hypothetical protein